MTSDTQFSTPLNKIDAIHKAQVSYFNTRKTLSIDFRRKKLKDLKEILIRRETEICNALYADFKKSAFESQLTEFIIIMMELNRTLKNLDKWTKPKRVFAGFLNFPSSSKIVFEPYGNTLIIAPWNYPFQLIMSPMIAAIAAGNTVLIKPSELTPHTSKLISEIISEIFTEEYIAVVQGGVEESQKLLSLKWDYLFFTGSPKVGQIVYEAAAKKLTPVTLELGGKNPCIIDDSAPLKLSAKRIIWGKFVNAGQTCIAPDYLIVHQKIKNEFIGYLKDELKLAYGKNPKTSPDFPRIINESNFERLQKLIGSNEVIRGAVTSKSELYISPTLLDLSSLKSTQNREDLPPVMQEEIFGPILPILTYSEEKELDHWISKFEKPLALYLFSKRKHFISNLLGRFSFGGGTINDVIVQFTNHRLPFGGVGHSGIGAYHGYTSFETFSHKKSIAYRGTWLDLKLRYAPYNEKVKWVQKLSKWL